MKFLVVLTAVISTFSFAGEYKVKESSVEFLALARPGALKIKGKSKEDSALNCKLELNKSSLSGPCTFKLDSLNSGIDLRDKHMKEKYLETGKFPTSELHLTKLILPGNFSGEDIPFEGKLKLHGVEKPVSGKVKANGNGTGKELKLAFSYKISTADFKIETPNFMGVTMANEVEVSVNLEGAAN